MPLDYQTLCDSLRAAGFSLFDREPYGAKNCAQANLRGRSFYVSDSTLSFHHSRVLTARILHGGAAFLIIESTALDMRNTARGFRFVLFDVDGEIIHAPDLEGCQKSKAQALVAFWSWFNGFDLENYYAEKMAREAEKQKRQAAELAKHAKTLSAKIKRANGGK